jgi:hypothetical protein
MQESRIGTEEECAQFSRGTDPGTKGWWYHGTREREARSLTDGTKRFEGIGEVCFTRNPQGASQHHGKFVIRAMLHVDRNSGDHYYEQDASVGITGGFDEIKVYGASCIMVERCYLGDHTGIGGVNGTAGVRRTGR